MASLILRPLALKTLAAHAFKSLSIRQHTYVDFNNTTIVITTISWISGPAFSIVQARNKISLIPFALQNRPDSMEEISDSAEL